MKRRNRNQYTASFRSILKNDSVLTLLSQSLTTAAAAEAVTYLLSSHFAKERTIAEKWQRAGKSNEKLIKA
jgi:hypothetical protein